MRIPTTTDTLISSCPFHLSAEKQQPSEEIILQYERQGVIEDAQSPWNSPAFLVPKPQAKPDMPASKRWRLIEDDHEINDVV